ncbi:MAG: SPFH domain-containing protein [Chloroflexi bacterium]|nr:SPFH domain-containing protein [Chloroflexota bacterium]
MARIFDVVEYLDPSGREMVHRVPEHGSGDFRLGSQLIVRESQTAVFFRDGKALDTFGPGRHTLSTNNIPLLIRLISIPFSGETPFKAEVYFVNMKEFLDQKWGTPEPIALRDKELGLVRLRAFGTYSMQVGDPQLFVNKIVGTQGLYDTNQISNFLRSMIVSKMVDLLGETHSSLFDLPKMYEEIGAGVKAKTQDDFANVGIVLKTLYVNSISPTEETSKAIDERAAMGAIGNMQAYLQFKAARAMGDAATAGGEAGSLTGAGVGLGAGVGIGAAMAGAISEALRGGQQPPAQQQAAGPTVACPSCGTANPAGANFCNNCGTRLAGPVKCPNCGHENAAGAKFCNNCGTKLQ